MRREKKKRNETNINGVDFVVDLDDSMENKRNLEQNIPFLLVSVCSVLGWKENDEPLFRSMQVWPDLRYINMP